MVDLISFLRARLDEDDLTAREANMSPEMIVGIPRCYADAPLAAHIAQFANPDRVLREIEAKRAVVAKYEYWNDMADKDGIDALSPWCRGERHGWWAACRILAHAYADDPDYQAEWTLGQFDLRGGS